MGKEVGPIRVALDTARNSSVRRYDESKLATADWIAPDNALPEDPSVQWRKKHFPKVSPTYRVNSILTVMELVAQGLGVGLLPIFLAQGHKALRALTSALDECQTEFWLLTHPESRHLRRVSTVFGHLSRQMALA